MDISRIINFLNENYAYNADEIYECLNLLVDTLDSTLAAIQHASANAFAQRDFSKIKQQADMADEINSMQEKIKGYMEQLRVSLPDDGINMPDDDTDDSSEETDNPLETSAEEAGKAYEEQPARLLDQEDYKADSSIKHTLNEDFSFKKPAAIEIGSTRLEVRDWRDLFFLTCETLVRMDRSIFESFISDPSMNGRRVMYFSKSRRGMTAPRKLPGTDIYVSMQLGANGIRRLISKMLRRYNIDDDKCYVYFSEDYSSLIKK